MLMLWILGEIFRPTLLSDWQQHQPPANQAEEEEMDKESKLGIFAGYCFDN
jgi:hypothetical protein